MKPRASHHPPPSKRSKPRPRIESHPQTPLPRNIKPRCEVSYVLEHRALPGRRLVTIPLQHGQTPAVTMPS
jgi:hypothetical protein